MIGRGLFGGAGAMRAGVPGAQRLMDLRRDDEDENQRRRRGLFGGLRDSFSQEGLARTNRAGVTRGEQLGAMLMSLAGPQQQAQAMNMLGDARARGREDRLIADERRRQAMATQQAANDQRMALEQERERLNALADSFGLQGPQRIQFLMSPEEARNEFINSRMNPEAPGAPTTRTVNRGGEVVTEEWTGQGWQEVGRGPRSAGPLVNVNTGEGGQANPYADAYRAATEARTEAILTEVGPAAERRALQLDRLDGLLASNETGLGAAARLFASDFGLEIGENVGELQAARALINSLVPELRPPNSGTFTDADARLARESLPRLINTPGGNELVMGTLRRINDYDRQLYRLTQQVGRGDITEQEYDAAVASLANPLDPVRDALNGAVQSPQGGPATRITSDEEYDALPSGALYVGPDGVTRRKP